jgi:hypothetical protein
MIWEASAGDLLLTLGRILAILNFDLTAYSFILPHKVEDGNLHKLGTYT